MQINMQLYDQRWDRPMLKIRLKCVSSLSYLFHCTFQATATFFFTVVHFVLSVFGCLSLRIIFHKSEKSRICWNIKQWHTKTGSPYICNGFTQNKLYIFILVSLFRWPFQIRSSVYANWRERVFFDFISLKTQIFWPFWRNQCNAHNGIQQNSESRALIKHRSEHTSKNATIYVYFLQTIYVFLMPAMKNVHRIYLWHVLRDTPNTGSALGDCQLNHVVCRIFCNLSRSLDKRRSKRNHHNKRSGHRVAKI